ncbi:hypothetical protein Taro_050235 [Colocasia esculenta]|uniref:Uncharacterized protein n=1 Tax=Colocasia esculenta TaxID=4460 RepID=A0A843XD76_COLES|nr:hypothetical protein [Colocasia esculenta]
MGITLCSNDLCDHNSESALRDGRQSAGFAEFCFGAKIRRVACVLVHRLSYPLGRMRIFFAPAIGNARKVPIQNRHFDPVGTRSHSEISGPAPKFLSGSMVVGRRYLFARRSKTPAVPQLRIGTSTRSAQGRIQRFPVRHPNSSPGAWSQAVDAIAYGHPFAQMCITFRSVIRITYKTPIRNRHSEAPIAPLLPQPTIFPILRFSGCSTSLDYANRWRGQHMESAYHVVFNSTRDLHPKSWKWVHEHCRYSHPLRFIPTPSAKELGITFRLGIRMAYLTTIRNRHSETILADDLPDSKVFWL